MRAMKNYAGHRLSPWLVSPTNELVLVSGIHTILAKKARYYEDRRLQERILPPPSLARLAQKLPSARGDDWSALLPVAVAPKPATDGPSGGDLDSGGIRREPCLPNMRQSRRKLCNWPIPSRS